MLAVILLVVAAILAIENAVEGLLNCDDVLSESSLFTGKCDNKWKNLKPLLKPTQPQVGYAWIQYKLDKDFTSENDAQAAMDDSATPAVIGPGPAIYIVDDHHTLCALDFAGYEDVKATMNILCDMRNYTTSDFWATLSSQNLAYLASHPKGKPNELPVSISYTEMPSRFSFTKDDQSLSDDPWRSLAGYARKVQSAPSPTPSCSDSDSKYCERCMYRGCVDGYQLSGAGVPFFEFRWAYFINDATYYSTRFWSSTDSLSKFISSYSALPASEVGKVDTGDWMDTAELAIALCRDSTTSKYTLPSTIFAEKPLPGYFEGYVKLEDDPDCAKPVCVMTKTDQIKTTVEAMFKRS